MDPREFLVFLRRRMASIVVVVLIFFGLAMGYTQQSSAEEGATIFLTIGAQLPDGVSVGALGASQNENVVDQFTQTVQGWVSNPEFVRDVQDLVQVPVGLSVRKQEKQNLLVTVHMPAEHDGAKSSSDVAEQVVEAMNTEIASYNELTNASFVVAVSSVTPYVNAPNWKLNGMVGILLGLIIGIVGFALVEYSRRTLTFEFQASSLFGKESLVRLKSGFSRSDLEGFINLYARKDGGVSLLEIGNTGLSQHKAYLKDHSIDLIEYPAGLKDAKLKETLVAAVKLGESPEDHIRELRLLHGEVMDYLLMV
jgi:capsular polysaccharide biosynthesis protein